MKKQLLALFMVMFCLIAPVTGTELAYYTFAGNHKCLIDIPISNEPLPVIIYHPDEFREIYGDAHAIKKGYIIREFIEAFRSWGYATVVPIGGRQNINVHKGALHYINKHPKLDNTDIHIIGHSESAFTSLLSIGAFPNVKTVTLLGPKPPHSMGYYSLVEFARQIHDFHAPVLFFTPKDESIWDLRQSRILVKMFRQNDIQVSYNEVDSSKRFFWSPENSFFRTIKYFIDEESLKYTVSAKRRNYED